MKYYVIAGEASGDLHGANLMKQLKVVDSNAEFKFWGGDLMSEIGGKPIKHIKELAFMGFVEVVQNLRTISKNFKICKETLLEYKPDALILIDYPGFNLRMAKFAKENGIKVFYYISPQVWAWKKKRVFKIKKYVDEMYVILPFEKDFYNEYDYKVDFVGHPLLDAIENRKGNEKFRKENNLSDSPIIALLPGSRNQEISVKLPIMLSVVDKFPGYQFVIAGAPSQEASFYQQFINKDNVKLVENVTYDLLENSTAALVTSGTATLETALFNVPEVVCYKGSNISYQIAKRIINVKYISLVNLIMDREVVTELIQNELNTKNLITELNKLLNESTRKELLKEYDLLHNNLGGIGASKRTAELMFKALN